MGHAPYATVRHAVRPMTHGGEVGALPMTHGEISCPWVMGRTVGMGGPSPWVMGRTAVHSPHGSWGVR
jgi:hypothetical protein